MAARKSINHAGITMSMAPADWKPREQTPDERRQAQELYMQVYNPDGSKRPKMLKTVKGIDPAPYEWDRPRRTYNREA